MASKTFDGGICFKLRDILRAANNGEFWVVIEKEE